MITTLDLPKLSAYVACSGGVDSMAAASFLINGKRSVKILHFNHGTEHSSLAEQFVSDWCSSMNVQCKVGRIAVAMKPKEKSWEEHWRDERYKFLRSHSDMQIVTAHTLDDQVMQWLYTSVHGQPRFIPYRNGNIVRPFILTKKSSFVSWCETKNVPYVEDPSNDDTSYMRNLIRKEMLPAALKVNPGLYKSVKKALLEKL